MSTRFQLFAFLSVWLLAAGCSETFKQDLNIHLTHGDVAAPGVELRLYAERGCRGVFESMVTTENGTTGVTRIVERHSLFVVTDEISLCIENDGDWEQLWWSLHGPAPRRVDASCDLDSHSQDRCRVTMDGRAV